MINNIGKLLLIIVISLATVISFDYYKENYLEDKIKDTLLVFSAKDIIENKKLKIHKAQLTKNDTTLEEKELKLTIQMIDTILIELSIKLNKPIFKRESIISGDIKDITPLVKSKLKARGLL